MVITRIVKIGGRLALCLSGSVLLAACNGGSSDNGAMDNGANGTDDPPARVDTLEYVLDYKGGSGDFSSLIAVPPSQPDAWVEVDSEVAGRSRAYYTFGVTSVIAARTATTSSANGLHVASVLYPRMDGTLWRLGTDPEAFPPTPAQVSSAKNLNRICMRGVPQPAIYTDADATPFVYVLSADGTGCEDSLDAGTATWHFVLLGDDAGTAPRDFPTPDPLTGDFDYSVKTKAGTIVNLQDRQGDHAGWLIRQGGMLTRVGPDGKVVAADIAPVVDGFELVAAQLDSGVALLNVGGTLMAFDPATNGLKDLGFALGPYDVHAASDGRELYVTRQNALYRTTGGGRDVVKIDTDPNDPGGASSGSRTAPLVGSDRVVWLADARGGEQALRSVDKSATDVGSGESIANFEGDALSLLEANSDQWLFYGEAGDVTAGPAPMTAVALRMDGSEREAFADSAWIGYTRASQVKAGSGASAARVYRVADLSGGGGGLAGKRLLSLAANDPTNDGATIELGVIPSDSENAVGPFISPGFGPGRLVTRVIAATQTDILFFQDDQPGSLQRITDNDDDQFALPGF